MPWDSEYFTTDEMRCKCGCGQVIMNEAFMQKLNFLRECYGKPMIISSAYRCENHPVEARKSKPGAHNTGKAVDVVVSRGDAHELLSLALQAGFTGIGVKQKGDGRFLHLDTCTNEEITPRPTIWSY